jgi:hypothetical protein
MNEGEENISFSSAWKEGALTEEQLGQLTPVQLEK